ncbi:hypothetical protein BH09ACT4_BH09ACT4_15340 [soil metagenome]
MTTTETTATTATATRPHTVPTASGSLHLRPVSWHKPLLVLAAAMVLLAAFATVASFVDTREVTGVNLWLKPLKFAISTAVYSVTLSWLIGQLNRLRRAAWIAGTIATIGLAIELIIITGFAAVGDSSHFNVTTPIHTAAWAIMATSISVVWVMTLIVAFALFRNRLGDRARTLAIRAGALIALRGMALAFLMTGPQGDQISNYQGVVGAHTIGLADGGPGLPLLGWSTIAGDLRIPHFIGMHALQVLPIFAIVLELLARRVPRVADETLRMRWVAIASVTYLAVIGIVTAQALSGESIVQPSLPFVVGAVAVAVGAVIAGLVSIRRGAATQPPA